MHAFQLAPHREPGDLLVGFWVRTLLVNLSVKDIHICGPLTLSTSH